MAKKAKTGGMSLAEFEATAAKLEKKGKCVWCAQPREKRSRFCGRTQCQHAYEVYATSLKEAG